MLALEPPADHDGWPLTLSDPGAPDRVLARLSARQMALSASGLQKGDHILDPRTRKAVRGRRGAWVLVPRPARTPPESDALTDGPTAAAGTVADALTTAFMLLGLVEIGILCRATAGLEAWVLEPPPKGSQEEARLVHFGGPGATANATNTAG